MARDAATAAAAPGPRPTFPVYLLPSFKMPFRRRSTASSSSSSSSSSSVPEAAGAGLSASPPASPSSRSSTVYSPATTPGSSPPSAASFPDFYFPLADKLALERGELARRSSSYYGAAPGEGNADSHPGLGTRLSRAGPDTLRCGTCSADLAFGAQIVSKGFTGRYGRAYLVSPPPRPPVTARAPTSTSSGTDLVNIRVGRPESRQLVTGAHVVADISCLVCAAKLGWKYVDAKEQSQKYKVGKFILETQRVVGFRRWEDVDDGTLLPEVAHLDVGRPAPGDRRASKDEEEPVEFDSDDEDECEDIFAGTWDAQAVAERRGHRFVLRGKKRADD